MKAIPLIRFLQFTDPKTSGSGLASFRTTIEALRRLADVPRLTLILDIQDLPHINLDGDLLEAQNRTFERKNRPIMDSFDQWKGLNAFFAHVRLSSTLWDGTAEHRARWEKKFEAMVMGEDYRSDKKIKQAILARYEDTYCS